MNIDYIDDAKSSLDELLDAYQEIYKVETDYNRKANIEKVKYINSNQKLEELNANKNLAKQRTAEAEKFAQATKLNNLKIKAIEDQHKRETTYQNKRWQAEEAHIKRLQILEAAKATGDDLDKKISQVKAESNLYKDNTKEGVEYRRVLLDNLNKEQTLKEIESTKAIREAEFKLAHTYNNKEWAEKEKNILKSAALKEELDKTAQLKQQELQNAANEQLLKDQEYQAKHRENVLKEVENNLDAERIRREQEALDRKSIADAGLEAKQMQIQAKYDLEDAQEQKLQEKKKKYAENLAKKGKTASDEEWKAAEKRFKKQIEHEEKISKMHEDRERGKAKAEAIQSAFDPNSDMNGADRLDAIASGFTNEDGEFSFKEGLNTLASLAQLLNDQIETITSYKSVIDTRLQGSNMATSGTNAVAKFLGVGNSYWDEISKQITGAAGVSPYVKQEDIANNVQSLVEAGIATNVAQRAFLQTIKDKVDATFDATNGTLLRLVRIQQQDSTAARLGMESMITQFLNNMYENTEYLSQVSTSVKSSLEDAMALMSAENAISFEYQVQKWLGSYYSVGVSDSTVQSLAASLGKISSGDITGITSGGTGNLLVMAANQARLSVAELLAKGLDESSTNSLMQAMSGYLNELLQNSSDNLVVQQQIANVYGMTAADLKAIANLYTDNGKTVVNIAKSTANYSESMNRLVTMVNSIGERTSIGERMTNAFQNLQYTISAGIANNPALYAIYKIGGLLEDTVGGIDLPFINVWGFGLDLNTSIAQLMQVGAMAGSLISGIGQMITTGGGGGITPGLLLNGFGINANSGMTAVSRGSGIGGRGMTVSGSNTSESGYAGNSSGSDVKQKTLDEANSDANAQMAESKDTHEEATTTDINNNLLDLIGIFKEIIAGSSALHVKVDDYGLTGWN